MAYRAICPPYAHMPRAYIVGTKALDNTCLPNSLPPPFPPPFTLLHRRKMCTRMQYTVVFALKRKWISCLNVNGLFFLFYFSTSQRRYCFCSFASFFFDSLAIVQFGMTRFHPTYLPHRRVRSSNEQGRPCF